MAVWPPLSKSKRRVETKKQFSRDWKNVLEHCDIL